MHGLILFILVFCVLRIARAQRRQMRAQARAAQELSDAFGRAADEIERRDATVIEGERYRI